MRGGTSGRIVVRSLLAVLVIGCSAPAPVATGGGSASPPVPVAVTTLPGTATWTPLPAAPAFLAANIRSDGGRVCAVARDGRVACWGDLGGDPYVHTGVVHELAGVTDAVDVVSLPTEICVVRRDGSARCLAISGSPQLPALPANVVEIAETTRAVCVRERAGTVACADLWDRGPFAPIAGIAGATSLICMANGCCATTPAGVQCFGDEAPEIGIVASTDARPIARTLPAADQIAYHSFGACVKTLTGGAHCWGDAAKLTRSAGVHGVALFDHDLCVIGDDGTIACARTKPAATNVLDADGSCLVHRDGSASCTGTNLSGDLGDGRPSFMTTPRKVPDLPRSVDLRVTETQACAVAADRTMTCWGWTPRTKLAGASGLLGSGDEPACWIAARTLTCHQAKSLQPATLTVATAAVSIREAIQTFAMQGDSLCVVVSGGKLRCASPIWTDEPEWVAIKSSPVAEVHEHVSGICARQVDGRVGCFSTDDEITPGSMVPVPGITDAMQLTGGDWGSCVRTRGGEVACWSEREPALRPVPGLRGATQISTRGMHVCGIVQGEVRCAGLNTVGQLGDGTRVDPDEGAAVTVRSTFKPVKIGVAGRAACALDDSGDVWCWGSDQHGELGQGRLPHVDSPRRVVGVGPRP